jgi:hypothetical protein
MGKMLNNEIRTRKFKFLAIKSLIPALSTLMPILIFYGPARNLHTQRFALMHILTIVIYFLLIYVFKEIILFHFSDKEIFTHFAFMIIAIRIISDFWISKNTLKGIGDINSDLTRYLFWVQQYKEVEDYELINYPSLYFETLGFFSREFNITVIQTYQIGDFVSLTLSYMVPSLLVYFMIDRKTAIWIMILLSSVYVDEYPWKTLGYTLTITCIFILLTLIRNKEINHRSISGSIVFIHLLLILVALTYTVPVYFCLGAILLSLIHRTMIITNLLVICVWALVILNEIDVLESYFQTSYMGALILLLIPCAIWLTKSDKIATLISILVGIYVYLRFNINDSLEYLKTLIFDMNSIFPYFQSMFVLYLFVLGIDRYRNYNWNNTKTKDLMKDTGVILRLYGILVLTKLALVIKFYSTGDVSLYPRIDVAIYILVLIGFAVLASNLYSLYLLIIKRKIFITLLICSLFFIAITIKKSDEVDFSYEKYGTFIQNSLYDKVYLK